MPYFYVQSLVQPRASQIFVFLSFASGEVCDKQLWTAASTGKFGNGQIQVLGHFSC